MTKNEIQKLSEHSERITRVETKIDAVEKKLDNIDKKIDDFFIAMNKKADKEDLVEVRTDLSGLKSKALFQALGLIATLILAILALQRAIN